jgi:hypothetical protein
VPVPLFSRNIDAFELRLWDSTGAEVPLKTYPIRGEFLESGVVLFPNVTPGCVLALRIEFKTHAPVTYHEHWFSGDIPTVRARFTFSHLDNFSYEFKSYGPLEPGSPGRTGKHLRRVWEQRDILPRARIEHQGSPDLTEPRVSLVLRSAFGRTVHAKWSALVKQYAKQLLKTSFFGTDRRLAALTDSLTEGLESGVEKGDAIVRWIQDNLSIKNSPLGSINPDEVVKRRQGNMWEITVVVREALRRAGITTDLLVTRPHTLGGFDPDFPTPAVLTVPLVVAEVGDMEYVAFPFRRGGRLGDYPIAFGDLEAISLRTGTTRMVPPPRSKTSYTIATFLLDLAEEGTSHSLQLEYRGYLAYYMRGYLMDMKEEDITEGFQKVLTGFGRSNALTSCTVRGLPRYGRPLIANITFENPGQVIERKGTVRVSLEPLFGTHFESYDTSRTTPFVYNMEHVDSVTVRITKPAGKSVSVSIPCEPVDNELFSVRCGSEDEEEVYEFGRSVAINAVRVEAERMRGLAADIASVNAIEDSYVLVE